MLLLLSMQRIGKLEGVSKCYRKLYKVLTKYRVVVKCL